MYVLQLFGWAARSGLQHSPPKGAGRSLAECHVPKDERLDKRTSIQWALGSVQSILRHRTMLRKGLDEWLPVSYVTRWSSINDGPLPTTKALTMAIGSAVIKRHTLNSGILLTRVWQVRK